MRTKKQQAEQGSGDAGADQADGAAAAPSKRQRLAEPERAKPDSDADGEAEDDAWMVNKLKFVKHMDVRAGATALCMRMQPDIHLALQQDALRMGAYEPGADDYVTIDPLAPSAAAPAHGPGRDRGRGRGEGGRHVRR